MSVTAVTQFAALSVIVAMGVCIVYVIFVVREVTTQIGAAVAALERTIRELRDHFDWREEQLADVLKDISDTIQNPGKTQSSTPEAKSDSANGNGNGHYIRLRKEVAGLDPERRFHALNDWVNANYLSFLRRASRGWSTPADLITHIPAYFEAQAEITKDDFLLIGTRGHPEKVFVRLDNNEFDARGDEDRPAVTDSRRNSAY